MSSSPPSRPPSEIAAELSQLQEQMQHSLQALKQASNPTQLVHEIVSRPRFPLLAFAAGGLALVFLGYQVWRKLRRPSSKVKKLPKPMQKQLPLLREVLQLPEPTAKAHAKGGKGLAQSAGKSLLQVVWKAATPLLINTLRKQLGTWLK